MDIPTRETELRKLRESTQKAILLEAKTVQFVKMHTLRMKRLRNLKR